MVSQGDFDAPVGLCIRCRHVHPIRSDRGPVYYRCSLSARDGRFAKYPLLPKQSCRGFEAASPNRVDRDRGPTIERARATPVPASERIAAIDVLRGVAVLGILLMNIQGYAMIDAAYFNPTAYGDLTGVNLWVWALSHILADQKFMTIFSMLFGAGILLMNRRQESQGKDPSRTHRRRMGILLLFGLLHAYLVWHGDILVYYALCGLALCRLRHRSPRFLLILGLVMISVASAFSLASGWSMQFWSADQIEDLGRDWKPPPALVTAEISAFRGDWLGQVIYRAPKALEFQTFVFLIWGFWRAGGLVLVGMALLKLDILTGRRSAGFYNTLIGLAVALGIPAAAFGIYRHFQSGWNAAQSFFIISQYNYWASLIIAMGWIGLVMRLCASPKLERVVRPLGAVGRMALSNYLGQSIVCTLIFYGHGFGLYGHMERFEQATVVAGVWVFQIIVSSIWLRYFRFGPFEWLWRSLTYRQRQPMRT